MSMPTRRVIREVQKSNLPLCAAVQRGDAGEVRRLILEEKVDVNLVDDMDKSAIFYAVVDHPEFLDILLENGASTEIIDKEPGYTPLAYAASYMRVEAAKKLLAHGSDPNRIVGPTNTCALMIVLSRDKPSMELINLLLGSRSFTDMLLGVNPCPAPTIEILNAAINMARMQDEYNTGFRPIINKLEAYRRKNYIQDQEQEFGYRLRPPSTLATIAAAVVNVITLPFRMLAQGISALVSGGAAAMPTLRSISVMPKPQTEQQVPVDKQVAELRGMLANHYDHVCAMLLSDIANAGDKTLSQKRHLVDEAVIFADMRDRIQAETNASVFCKMVETYLSHFDLVLMAQKASPSFVGDFSKEIPDAPEGNPAVVQRRKSVVFSKLSPDMEKEVLALGAKFEALKRSI